MSRYGKSRSSTITYQNLGEFRQQIKILQLKMRAKCAPKCNKKVKKRNFNFKAFFDDVISFCTDNQYMKLYLQLPLCPVIQEKNGVSTLVFALF